MLHEGFSEALEKRARALLSDAIHREFSGRIALVSSFGAESIVLLHMLAELAPDTPVLFNETGMLFPETLAYQRDVATQLGLSNVILVRPSQSDVARDDPDGSLHIQDADACCALRKTAPLKRALARFDAWITGRKRFQTEMRRALPFRESDEDGRAKLNPLADWSPKDLRTYIDSHALPRHPLVEKGYPSIGCWPCTTPVLAGEDGRAGRWRGAEKIECGIHIANGRVVRGSRPEGA